MNEESGKILVIDANADFRKGIIQCVQTHFSKMVVEEYDPVAKGKPKADFNWDNYAIVLLDHILGHEENGLVWLRQLQQKKYFPPILFMSDESNAHLAVKSLKIGALNYMDKKTVSIARFSRLIQEALRKYESLQEERMENTQTMDVCTQTDVFDETGLVDTNATTDSKSIKLPGYKILRQIGDGGMSVVFLAERTRDYAQIVLKILDQELAQDREFFHLFMREYGIISKLENPYVVKIHDLGLTENHAYIAMELFSNGDLKAYLRQMITSRRALEIVKQCAIALQGIHEVGIVHRDIKPANIMFRKDNTLGVVDFGIATKMDESDVQNTGGKILGTPAYMSPEQGKGESLDGRSDLYSLGIMFYEMLLRQRPFRATSAPGLVAQHIHEDIPRMPAQFAEYQPFIDKLLAKKTKDRYANGQVFVNALLQKWPTL